MDLSDVERNKRRTAALVKELKLKKQEIIKDAELQASMLQQEIESLGERCSVCKCTEVIVSF